MDAWSNVSAPDWTRTKVRRGRKKRLAWLPEVVAVGERAEEDAMIAKVSHMVLPVSDLRKSRDWYVDKLGLRSTVNSKELSGSGISRA